MICSYKAELRGRKRINFAIKVTLRQVSQAIELKSSPADQKIEKPGRHCLHRRPKHGLNCIHTLFGVVKEREVGYLPNGCSLSKAGSSPSRENTNLL